MSPVDLSSAPFLLDESEVAWVETTLASLSPEQRVGQLLCVMGGDFSLDELKALVAAGRVGAVLYRPAPTDEVRSCYDALDEVASVPLLHAANLEEGGSGIASDGTLFGWPMLVSATGDAVWAQRLGEVCAAEGAAAGVNWTFSPVSDLDLNSLNPITNVRTFGSDVDQVMEFTGRYVDAVQSRGMAACAKHFPGDGVDFRDQHLHPTYNSLGADEWRASYGRIYQHLIARGLLGVMVGHIVQVALEQEKNPSLAFGDCLPASMSPELIGGVLRGDLGFNGVVATDATIMGGYCQPLPRSQALVASIMAGCDVLVFNTDYEEDFGYLMAALKDGRLTSERLDDAVRRVLALKVCVCNRPKAQIESVPAAVWHRDCVDRAITLVKDMSSGALPITADRYPHVRLVVLGKDEILDGSVRAIACEHLEQAGFAVEVYDPFADDLHGTSGIDDKRVTIMLANLETASNQTTVRISWCEKHALDMPRFVNEETIVFVSLANPYLLRDVPRVKTYVNAYTATKDSICLALDKLMGRSKFYGVSPVDAFCGLEDTRI